MPKTATIFPYWIIPRIFPFHPSPKLSVRLTLYVTLPVIFVVLVVFVVVVFVVVVFVVLLLGVLAEV